MIGYLKIYHPHRIGEELTVVPTGRTENEKAEVFCLTPKSGISKMWITKSDIITPTP